MVVKRHVLAQTSTWDGLAHRLEQLRHFINSEVPNSRERSLVLTKLDEAEMWLERASPRWHEDFTDDGIPVVPERGWPERPDSSGRPTVATPPIPTV